MEAIGRNPEVIGPILVPLLIGLGFAEAIAIYALVIAFILVGKGLSQPSSERWKQSPVPSG